MTMIEQRTVTCSQLANTLNQIESDGGEILKILPGEFSVQYIILYRVKRS